MKMTRWIGFAWLAGVAGAMGENSPSDLMEMMVSERAEVVAEGERLFAADQDGVLDELLKAVASGDPRTGGKAAAELGILLSPWLRGKEAGARFVEYTHIPSPRRPVGRMSGHPRAAAIREALRAGIGKLLEKKQERATNFHLVAALKAQCETLGEVADDATVTWALEQLGKQPPAERAEALAGLVNAHLGLPPVFRGLGLCGNSTAEEMARFDRLQNEEIARTHRTLQAAWGKVREMEPEDRIRFSIAAWRNHFVPMQQRSSGHFHHEDWLFDAMEPLVRFGPPAVAALRAQQQSETELEAKGVWEVVIATITGKEDPALVKELFAGRDPHVKLACEVVAGAGSKDWLKVLDELQRTPGSSGGKAGAAIAICHGFDGLPVLKKAPDRNKYLILELEARLDGKLRPGLRRHPFP